MADTPRLTLEQYAALLASLPEAEPERSAVLSEHGLDEESWGELDAYHQAELDAALDAAQDEEVPEVLARFSRGLVQRDEGGAPPLPLEKYAAVLAALQRGRDPREVFESEAVHMPTYMRAHSYWTVRLVKDSVLYAQFQRLLAGPER